MRASSSSPSLDARCSGAGDDISGDDMGDDVLEDDGDDEYESS